MSEIKGYKALTEEQIAVINEGKILEEQCLRFIDRVAGMGNIHQQHLHTSRINIQGAFMWLNRGIARPERVRLEGDPPAEEIAISPPE
jgi:hypothetical protein